MVFALGSMIAVAGIACLAVTRGPGRSAAARHVHGLRIQLPACASRNSRRFPPTCSRGELRGDPSAWSGAGGRLGGAIGPVLGGWLFDVTGGYELAFAAAGLAVTGPQVAAVARGPAGVVAGDIPPRSLGGELAPSYGDLKRKGKGRSGERRDTESETRSSRGEDLRGEIGKLTFR
jgi:MFS family permease